MADRKRLINDLRVIDLRAELEKRNLEKTGVRGVLIQRLSKYLEEQGEDPATFTFEQKLDSEAMEKSPVKQTRRSSSKAEQESCDNPVESEDADNNDILDLGDDELLNEEAENDDKEKENQEKDDAGEETAVADAAAADGGADADAVADADADADAATDPQDTPDPAAASGQSENKDDDKDDKADTEKESESKKSGALNLWVSGLSSATRAKDLKLLCNKHGKVIAAKVVTSARTPGSRCYGYVTMASAEDVENCIKVLHKTELHGRIISVEKAKSEDAGRARTRDEDGDKVEEKPRKDEEPPSVRRSTSRTREKSHRSDKDRESQMRMRASRLARARAERAERARAERRRAADAALRERERAQRDERRRLEVEREKLRAEREKIEREKNELLQLERERQKLEREKLELERLELKRAQLRLEEERRKRYDAAPAYRKPSPPQYRDKRDPPAAYKPTARQYSPPPPPRFDPKDRREREYERAREPDYKRTYSRPVVSNPVKYTTNGAAKYEARPPPPVVARPKETGRASSREPRPAPYRAPEKPDPRWAATAARYPDAVAHKGAPPPRYTQETRPAAYTAYPAPTYYTQTREYRKY